MGTTITTLRPHGLLNNSVVGLGIPLLQLLWQKRRDAAHRYTKGLRWFRMHDAHSFDVLLFQSVPVDTHHCELGGTDVLEARIPTTSVVFALFLHSLSKLSCASSRPSLFPPSALSNSFDTSALTPLFRYSIPVPH